MWPFQSEPHKKSWTETGVVGAVPMLALGAAAMYYFDPDRGRRRRALVRDKLFSAYRDAGDGLRKTAQYTRDRSSGLLAEARSSFRGDDADDYTICERVRSAIGRAVSHPGAIEVFSTGGVVTLRGPVLANEVDQLIDTVQSVRGVCEVEDLLDVHETPDDVPALQGISRRSRMRSGMSKENWDPFTRLIATTCGTGLALWGASRRDTLGLLGGTAGLMLATRGLVNMPARRLAGIGAEPCSIQVQKTISINAPLDFVFSFFSSYENFPSFMSNVREVRDYGDTGRSHWEVAGPMGTTVSWEAELTQFVPGEVIAWRSLPGATVANWGVIRFREKGTTTRVDIKLCYTPPAGALGHALAKLFAADPKSEMDQDLARVKTTLETGHPPRDAAQPLHAESAAHIGS